MTSAIDSLVVVALVLIVSSAEARQQRSTAERHSFVKESACPATGRHRLPCQGYIIDHIIPLCAGGIDKPSNMQWQTVEDAKVKDRAERRTCQINK